MTDDVWIEPVKFYPRVISVNNLSEKQYQWLLAMVANLEQDLKQPMKLPCLQCGKR
jgi:hypothetical protein